MFKTDLPTLGVQTSMPDVIDVMNRGRLGLAVVLSSENHIVGIITDGDLRRALNTFESTILEQRAESIMAKSPKTILPSAKLTEAEDLFNTHKITSLLVSEKNILLGILQLYSLTS